MNYLENLCQKKKELREAVVLPHPMPSNLESVRKLLDDFLGDIMKEKRKIQELNFENTLERIESKIHDVVGHLAKIWLLLMNIRTMGMQIYLQWKNSCNCLNNRYF